MTARQDKSKKVMEGYGISASMEIITSVSAGITAASLGLRFHITPVLIRPPTRRTSRENLPAK